MSTLHERAQAVGKAWTELNAFPAPEPLEGMGLEVEFGAAWVDYKQELHTRLIELEQVTGRLLADMEATEQSTFGPLRVQPPSRVQERIGLLHLQDGLGGAKRRVTDLQLALTELLRLFDLWDQAQAIVKRGWLDRVVKSASSPERPVSNKGR